MENNDPGIGSEAKSPPEASLPRWRASPNAEHRRIAVELMRSGMAGPNEIAVLLGLGHQIVRYWQHSARIDYRGARKAWLQKAWRRLA